jgi:hypothetical protein
MVPSRPPMLSVTTVPAASLKLQRCCNAVGAGVRARASAVVPLVALVSTQVVLAPGVIRTLPVAAANGPTSGVIVISSPAATFHATVTSCPGRKTAGVTVKELMPATTLAIDTPQTAPPNPSRRPSLLVSRKPRAPAPLAAARRQYKPTQRIKANGITLMPASYPWSHSGNHDIFFKNQVKMAFATLE